MERHGPAETLGLIGDGDDVDLLRSVEESFDVSFGDETVAWRTVGDLYEALLAQVPTEDEPGLCATSMSFYRLKATLARYGADRALINPSANLAGLTRHPPKRLLKMVEADLRVRGLASGASWWGMLGLLMLLLGIAAGFCALNKAIPWPWVLLAPAGVVMLMTDLGAFGRMTVGELARMMAIRNFARFGGEGADTRPKTVWQALCWLVAQEVDVEPSSIRPETRLLWKSG